eukprot:6393-Heterococcus_DN1.PRE.5
MSKRRLVAVVGADVGACSLKTTLHNTKSALVISIASGATLDYSLHVIKLSFLVLSIASERTHVNAMCF